MGRGFRRGRGGSTRRAGIDAIGAFKKPRRDDDEGADARGTTDVVVPQSVSDAGARAKWGEIAGTSSSERSNDEVSDYMRHLSLYGVATKEAEKPTDGSDARMTEATEEGSYSGAVLPMRNYDLANGRWLDDIAGRKPGASSIRIASTSFPR